MISGVPLAVCSTRAVVVGAGLVAGAGDGVTVIGDAAGRSRHVVVVAAEVVVVVVGRNTSDESGSTATAFI